ncbi:PaaI family thioesterase [Nonlabens ponticola]|uniref:DUF4442 domain-containing protein n=1 Tax=Nonlabens ponticola TaxID=2496866 RepID=A0A3S9MV28_9FLAO|nr:DUF4442 domain-containing protein [Nonlabens ponticola]AZQ43028.1 DUF4442 domain-containing protein [Nonlabens ponticola]
MSFYQNLAKTGSKYMAKSTLLKYGFNLSPMYRRSTARITSVTDDLLEIKIKLPISWKNRNYMNSIFGGSMFAAVDPIPMVQLVNLLGDDYIVWDKAAAIQFKRPAREDLYASFTYTMDEVDDIIARVKSQDETEITKIVHLTDGSGNKIYCTVQKTIYIADKIYFKNKRQAKQQEL